MLFGADQLMKTYVEQNFDGAKRKKLTDRIVLQQGTQQGNVSEPA